MREVADTDGDKVEVQARFGTSLQHVPRQRARATVVEQMADADVDRLCAEYDELYDVVPELRPDGERRESLRDAARIELGLRAFLEAAARWPSSTPSRISAASSSCRASAPSG